MSSTNDRFEQEFEVLTRNIELQKRKLAEQIELVAQSSAALDKRRPSSGSGMPVFRSGRQKRSSERSVLVRGALGSSSTDIQIARNAHTSAYRNNRRESGGENDNKSNHHRHTKDDGDNWKTENATVRTPSHNIPALMTLKLSMGDRPSVGYVRGRGRGCGTRTDHHSQHRNSSGGRRTASSSSPSRSPDHSIGGDMRGTYKMRGLCRGQRRLLISRWNLVDHQPGSNSEADINSMKLPEMQPDPERRSILDRLAPPLNTHSNKDLPPPDNDHTSIEQNVGSLYDHGQHLREREARLRKELALIQRERDIIEYERCKADDRIADIAHMIPDFGNSPITAHAWIKLLDGLQQVYEIPNMAMLFQAAEKLCGTAERWYSVNAKEVRTWRTFRKLIRQKFKVNFLPAAATAATAVTDAHSSDCSTSGGDSEDIYDNALVNSAENARSSSAIQHPANQTVRLVRLSSGVELLAYSDMTHAMTTIRATSARQHGIVNRDHNCNVNVFSEGTRQYYAIGFNNVMLEIDRVEVFVRLFIVSDETQMHQLILGRDVLTQPGICPNDATLGDY